DTGLVRLALQLVARLLEIADVRLVHLPHVRHVEPARLKARPGDLLEATERLDLDRAELREVDLGHSRQGAARGRRAALERLLHPGFHVVRSDASLESA